MVVSTAFGIGLLSTMPSFADDCGLYCKARQVRIICHDAVEVLRGQIPQQSLDEVVILFPDPWPKKRHHKRRLVQGACDSL